MSSRKFLIMLCAVALVIGSIGITQAALNGNAVITQYHCTGCHGTSTIMGSNNASTVTKIMNAIAPGGMMSGITSYGINNLTQAEAQAIADVYFPPAPVACTGYTYSAWSPSVCPASGQQTRTVAANTPSGCTGTPSTAAVLTQSCTPSPVACTGYTYSAWSPSTCPASGQQTRTAANAPAGCTGTPSTAAVLTQSCTPATVACAGYTYSTWSPSVCPASGQQTRTAANAPAGCTGTPPTAAVLTQICNYVPPVTPPPTNGTMPVPTSKKVFSYGAVDLPVVSSDPAKAEPIGVGPVATGGNTIDVNVQVGPFAGPVNVSFVIYAPTLDSEDLYFMSSANGLKKLSKAVDEDQQSNISGQRDSGEQDSGQGSQPSSQFDRLIKWKNNVTGVNENIFAGPVSDLPSGVYTLVLVVKSGDNNYYRWVTHVTIP